MLYETIINKLLEYAREEQISLACEYLTDEYGGSLGEVDDLQELVLALVMFIVKNELRYGHTVGNVWLPTPENINALR